jgi:hypothetical protein
MPRKPQSNRSDAGSDSYAIVLAALDRLNHEKADLLEEIRQLRAAVSIYRRIAEQATANQLSAARKSA